MVIRTPAAIRVPVEEAEDIGNDFDDDDDDDEPVYYEEEDSDVDVYQVNVDLEPQAASLESSLTPRAASSNMGAFLYDEQSITPRRVTPNGSPAIGMPQPGDRVDAKNDANLWYHATVVRKKGHAVLISFDGFSSASNEWMAPQDMATRLAPIGTHAHGGRGWHETRLMRQRITTSVSPLVSPRVPRSSSSQHLDDEELALKLHHEYLSRFATTDTAGDDGAEGNAPASASAPSAG